MRKRFKFQVSGFRFQVSGFKFQVSGFKFQVPSFNIQYSIFNIQYSILLLLMSCGQHYSPKPSGYYRIDFPEKEYQLYDCDCPVTFEYPVYGEIVPEISRLSEPCWFNINFPEYKGTIHLTYKEIDDNFDQFIEDNWRFIYKGLIQRADAVNERFYENPDLDVYGIMYDIRGDAASNVQFFVTDSVKNFFRGSLYFTVRPNADSLAPVVAFFREDIIRLLETIEWKK